MKRLLHKAAIILYAMAFHLLHYPRSEKSEHQKKGTKEILIIYNGIIGDGVLFADYLEMFPQIFPVRDGWKISILCRKCCKKVLCEFFHKEYGVNFLEDFIDDSENLFHKYRSLVGSFRGKYYEKIFALPIENPCLNRLAFNIAGKEKIICGENEGEASDGSWYQRYFYRHAYNVRVQDAMGTMELKRYAGLIGKYGGNKVPARISHMSLGKENEKERKEYCVIGLGASTPEKIWDIANFAEVIRFIRKKYRWTVCLCGGEKERFLYGQLKRLIDCEGVECHIGKTSMEEWAGMIRGAVLYVGNDSAGVHIAASVGTPSVVVVGKWQYRRFFPYEVEEKTGKEKLPCAVFSKKQYDCVNCREKHRKKGEGNPACKRAIREGGPCRCLADITADQVIEAIEHIMNVKSCAEMG